MRLPYAGIRKPHAVYVTKESVMNKGPDPQTYAKLMELAAKAKMSTRAARLK